MQHKKEKLKGKKPSTNQDVYMSHDSLTGEVHIDKFNIDFLRYFRFRNIMLSFLGSIIGAVLLVFNTAYFNYISGLFETLSSLYLINLFGGLAFFILTWMIAHLAGPNLKQAARIAGRRGLFAFSVMTIVATAILVLSGKITWSTSFYYFIKYILIALLAEAFFVIPLDYGITAVISLKKNKMFKSI